MQEQNAADGTDNRSLQTVLVVDDDENWKYISRKMLKRAGVKEEHIATAKNGAEALDLLHGLVEKGQPLPAVVLLDIKMPVLDGFGFLKEINNSETVDLSQTKIYLCSSSFHSADREKASHYPITGFLNKPLSNELIQQVLAPM
ncbi:MULTISPECIES: response regulator [Rufibacter]|uniref:CheY-like chemotaxis protein n=1 Tax=Rufibacter quisquiliarum TaxID=1549639 RepID=A0A839G7I9_9BACT|nr:MULTISPECIES: response regulator [Rufibacter]MBA9075394.1 CheY-like chemotaxis protein [Rufibacter quisquiliarum]